MSDKQLTCRDCGATFDFTMGEQEFYAQRGFTNEPTRCPSCRAARRASREAGYGSSEGSYGRPRRTMTPAVCSACGKQTEVPFVPSGDKPVYCSECFESRRGASHERRRW
jgi:CxxC-x17-CxxC domain-containing protein